MRHVEIIGPKWYTQSTWHSSAYGRCFKCQDETVSIENRKQVRDCDCVVTFRRSLVDVSTNSSRMKDFYSAIVSNIPEKLLERFTVISSFKHRFGICLDCYRAKFPNSDTEPILDDEKQYRIDYPKGHTGIVH